jgi:hypothetical protein
MHLKLNQEKCVFGVKELAFVGDTISAEGIKPHEAKIQAIMNFETPNSKKDVQCTTLSRHAELPGKIRT